MTARPSFLVIMTDQHRADWLGCAGHPVVRTPAIDALAARGTRFSRYHVASPVCMPNRASFMTGRWPSAHRARNNGCPLPLDATTFVEALRVSGWRTALIGKSHLQPFTGRAPVGMRAMTTGPFEEAWLPDDGDYGHEEGDRYEADGRYRFPDAYYGFDHVDMVTGHGDECGGHYLQWLRDQTGDWERLRDPASALPHDYTCPQARRIALPESLYPTAWIRDRACDWLHARRDDDSPFLAFVSFPDPHHPFTPPGRYWSMYDPDDFSVPLPPRSHTNPPMPMAATLARAVAGEAPLTPQTAFALLDERQIREAMALSAGMLSMIDDAVGDIVATLQGSGRADETTIVFTADHGEYMGDFGLMLKGALALDGINRAPLIWTEPGQREGRVSRALASTVDLAPTILDRAGVLPWHGIQGESLTGCLDRDEHLRDGVLVEFNDAMPRMGFERPARVRTLVTDDARLSIYAGEDWGELYDRRTDPNDTNNLWESPEHADLRGELSLRLADAITATMDESPRARRLA